jgi:alpha-L-arabinofuranosidase
MRKLLFQVILLFSAGFLFLAAGGTPARITVQANQPAHRVAPTLWGIFFEDINLSADGGLYAELLRNRSFEDSDQPEHWTAIQRGGAEASMAVTCERPWAADPARTRNLRNLRLTIKTVPPNGAAGVANHGYWGVPVKSGEIYDLSLAAGCAEGFKGMLTVQLETEDGKVLARDTIKGLGADWKTFKATFQANGTDREARLVITTSQPGTLWLDMVSLFPRKTWKNRANGLRPDLAEMLAELQPAFVRFPGGCWVEGDTMKEAYRWKETIGPLAERRTQWNIWQYWATHGIGYHEYLQLSRDLNAEPLFCINVGMSHKENVPLNRMEEFVQDALDAIEYANGPVSSPWGALRAKNGHPQPFNLKYLEIGNENGGPAYAERWPLFHRAIKARYPEIQLIANVWGGYPTNPMPDIVDEHYYNTPEFFMQQAGRYDSYDRKGPKVFVGEYAVTRNTGQGNLRGAIGEAAFMTGLERNSDVVVMAAYAPLFVHVKHRRWNPDLINFDNSRAYGIPSYYVQQLFARNRGDVVLPTAVEAPLEEAPPRGGAIGVGTWATQAEFKDLKVVRNGQTLFESDFSQGTKGWEFLGGGDWKVQDGALRQSSTRENVRAVIGDRAWTDYNYTLKARKLGGAEGFLILFNVADSREKAWWNLGGWGNTRHAIEMADSTSDSVDGSIETGRWYDIRIETRGHSVKCFLDGRPIHDFTIPPTRWLFASATRDESARELILKVVNAAPEPREVELSLAGISSLKGPARLTVLTSEQGTDENSLDEPTKVAPRTTSLPLSGPTFRHRFPGNSLTVLRVPESQ